MVQIITCIVLGLAFSTLTYIYLKQRKIKHEVVFCIIMLISLIAFSILCEFLGIYWMREIQFICMVALCFPCAWIDIIERKIPNLIILVGLGIQLCLLFVEVICDSAIVLDSFKSRGIGIVIIAVVCGLGRVIIKDGIGMGDIKLLLLLAFMGGMDNTLSILFFTMIVAFFMGLFELIIRKKGKNAEIPFAPAILIGVIINSILSVLS